MPTQLSRRQFLESEKGIELRGALNGMVEDPGYNTVIRSMLVLTDDSQFIDKHMNYMSAYPTMDHWQYLSNLKLMTKVRMNGRV